MEIGRKIYYEIATGNVILNTGERQLAVVETTEDQDWELYSSLQPYQKSAVGMIQLNYGDYSENFSKYPFHIDVTQNPPVIAWDTEDAFGATLANVQTSKISQLRDMYQQTMASGFNVTISGGTQYTFGWTTDDKANLDATQTAIERGFRTFPVLYSDVHGNPVSLPDQMTLDLIESTAAKFFDAQHQQILSLVGEVNGAATNDAVNAIQWTPATY